jgi:hypothetical protein
MPWACRNFCRAEKMKRVPSLISLSTMPHVRSKVYLILSSTLECYYTLAEREGDSWAYVAGGEHRLTLLYVVQSVLVLRKKDRQRE